MRCSAGRRGRRDQYLRAVVDLPHPRELAVLAEARGIEEPARGLAALAPVLVEIDLDDHVIERERRRQPVVEAGAIAEAREHRRARDAHVLQQRDEQQRLVLAVAVATREHGVGRGGAMRAGAERDREVTHLRLHELERRDHPLLDRGLGLHRRDECDAFGIGRFAIVEQRRGPLRDAVPVLVLRELDPAIRREAVGNRRLERQADETVLLEHQRPHAVLRAIGGRRKFLREVAVRAPCDRAIGWHVDDHATALDRQRLLPAFVARPLVAEHGVGADHRVGDFERVADAQVVDQDRRGHDAAVHVVLEAGLALQEAHLRGRQPIEHRAVADHLQRVQHHALIGGNEVDRHAADLRQHQRIVDLHRATRVTHGLVADQDLAVDELQHRRSARLRLGDRMWLHPRRRRRVLHERIGRDLDLAIGLRGRSLRDHRG